VALAAFLIPVSKVVSLPGAVADIAPIHHVVERNIITTAEARNRLPVMNIPVPATVPSTNAEMPMVNTDEPGFIARAITAFMVVYPLMFMLVLFYSLICYAHFMSKLRRNHIDPHPFETDMLKEFANDRHTPKLIVSDYATTPMLIRIFKPVIVLPNREYSDEQLRGTLLHELTHMRRRDVAVKWISLLSCALHWFNPFAWVARREIDRVCELSCDEAVIRSMDKNEKQHYGETLISMASTKRIPLPVISTTMCEEKRALKERLTAIMKSRKHTKLTVIFSIIIILAVACEFFCRSCPVSNE
jgi:beta-lactamase regulating signal transducer with metallopeptidase domain